MKMFMVMMMMMMMMMMNKSSTCDTFPIAVLVRLLNKIFSREFQKSLHRISILRPRL
jgi:hypothetical protein